jgi:aldehyde dehydrogenase (NAD+)
MSSGSSATLPMGLEAPAELDARVDEILDRQRAHVRATGHPDARERIRSIRSIEDWIMANRDRIRKVLEQDLSKPGPEADLTEVLVPLSECRHTRRNLRRWMRPRRAPAPLALLGTRSRVVCEPRGVVLIIAPFNYPFLLCIHPLISALAAGNTVVIKPSEMAPNTARLVEDMVAELFPESQVAVFRGGIEVASALLRRPFDHIFFTGSPRVGSIVMRAAAEHHATTTLELGGKSPAVVDATAHPDSTAQKIAWGRFQNAGQTCIAPDYVLVEERAADAFVLALERALDRLYGTEPGRLHSPHLARVVDDAHLDRLRGLIHQAVVAGARIRCGGQWDRDRLRLAPTVLTDVNPDMAVMREEIFGPVLPVLTWREPEEAMALIQRLPRPLALYAFGRDDALFERLLRNTASGAVCRNDVIIQFMHPGLPFGGINASGQGSYHGWFGFRELSHERPVMQRGRFDPLRWLYPPYDGRVRRLIDLAVRYL